MTQTSQTIGVALIGAGMIAQTHLEALSAAREKVRLHAVMSRNPQRAKPLAQHYAGDPPVFTSDLSDITGNPDIQMVIVATPPSVRQDLIRPLVAAGKHILLEKPVARTLAEATEVVEICEKASTTLGLVFQHRVRAPAIAAAKVIETGKLGKLGVAEIAVPLWRDQSYYDTLGRGTYARDGGGVMITNAIHSINLALSFTGPVASVQAMTATSPLHKMEAEDFAVAGVTFQNGAVGSFIASTAMYPHRTETITLHYENGSLRMDKDSLQVSWRDGQTQTLGQDHIPSDGDPLLGGKHQWHQAIIEDFADAIRTGNTPIVSGREALESHRFIQAIEQSSRTGQPQQI